MRKTCPNCGRNFENFIEIGEILEKSFAHENRNKPWRFCSTKEGVYIHDPDQFKRTTKKHTKNKHDSIRDNVKHRNTKDPNKDNPPAGGRP